MPRTRTLESNVCSITQPYHIKCDKGYNYDHWGIDITGFNGSYNVLDWVVAHSDGVVVDVRTDCTGFENNSYGNYVMIRHPNGYYTLYAHLAHGTVQCWVGQSVRKGQRVVYMDNTGHSYGGHLHFEIRQPNGYQIDPEPYLDADLPNTESGVIFNYQVWDHIYQNWQPNVKNLQDFAGVDGSDVCCVYVDCNKGNVSYAARRWKGDAHEQYPDEGWLPEVFNRTDYAGVYNRPIDGFLLKSDVPAKYRVRLRKSGKFLPWVLTNNADYGDPENGFAGIIGEPIDAIQITPL